MALTKVNRGGLNTCISDSSDATFLTVDSSEQAVIKGEGSATTSLQQGLAKNWLNMNAGTSITDSFNTSSISDFGTGDYGAAFTSNMNNADHAQVGATIKGAGSPSASNVGLFSLGEGPSTSSYGPCTVANDTNAADRTKVFSAVLGDLA